MVRQAESQYTFQSKQATRKLPQSSIDENTPPTVSFATLAPTSPRKSASKARAQPLEARTVNLRVLEERGRSSESVERQRYAEGGAFYVPSASPHGVDLLTPPASQEADEMLSGSYETPPNGPSVPNAGFIPPHTTTPASQDSSSSSRKRRRHASVASIASNPVSSAEADASPNPRARKQTKPTASSNTLKRTRAQESSSNLLPSPNPRARKQTRPSPPISTPPRKTAPRPAKTEGLAARKRRAATARRQSTPAGGPTRRLSTPKRRSPLEEEVGVSEEPAPPGSPSDDPLLLTGSEVAIRYRNRRTGRESIEPPGFQDADDTIGWEQEPKEEDEGANVPNGWEDVVDYEIPLAAEPAVTSRRISTPSRPRQRRSSLSLPSPDASTSPENPTAAVDQSFASSAAVQPAIFSPFRPSYNLPSSPPSPPAGGFSGKGKARAVMLEEDDEPAPRHPSPFAHSKVDGVSSAHDSIAVSPMFQPAHSTDALRLATTYSKSVDRDVRSPPLASSSSNAIQHEPAETQYVPDEWEEGSTVEYPTGEPQLGAPRAPDDEMQEAQLVEAIALDRPAQDEPVAADGEREGSPDGHVFDDGVFGRMGDRDYDESDEEDGTHDQLDASRADGGQGNDEGEPAGPENSLLAELGRVQEASQRDGATISSRSDDLRPAASSTPSLPPRAERLPEIGGQVRFNIPERADHLQPPPEAVQQRRPMLEELRSRAVKSREAPAVAEEEHSLPQSSRIGPTEPAPQQLPQQSSTSTNPPSRVAVEHPLLPRIRDASPRPTVVPQPIDQGSSQSREQFDDLQEQVRQARYKQASREANQGSKAPVQHQPALPPPPPPPPPPPHVRQQQLPLIRPLRTDLPTRDSRQDRNKEQKPIEYKEILVRLPVLEDTAVVFSLDPRCAARQTARLLQFGENVVKEEYVEPVLDESADDDRILSARRRSSVGSRSRSRRRSSLAAPDGSLIEPSALLGRAMEEISRGDAEVTFDNSAVSVDTTSRTAQTLEQTHERVTEIGLDRHQFTKTAWKRLENCFLQCRMELATKQGMQSHELPPDRVIAEDVVRRFLEEEGVDSDEDSEWCWRKMVRRVVALQRRHSQPKATFSTEQTRPAARFEPVASSSSSRPQAPSRPFPSSSMPTAKTATTSSAQSAPAYGHLLQQATHVAARVPSRTTAQPSPATAKRGVMRELQTAVQSREAGSSRIPTRTGVTGFISGIFGRTVEVVSTARVPPRPPAPATPPRERAAAPAAAEPPEMAELPERPVTPVVVRAAISAQPSRPAPKPSQLPARPIPIPGAVDKSRRLSGPVKDIVRSFEVIREGDEAEQNRVRELKKVGSNSSLRRIAQAAGRPDGPSGPRNT